MRATITEPLIPLNATQATDTMRSTQAQEGSAAKRAIPPVPLVPIGATAGAGVVTTPTSPLQCRSPPAQRLRDVPQVRAVSRSLDMKHTHTLALTIQTPEQPGTLPSASSGPLSPRRADPLSPRRGESGATSPTSALSPRSGRPLPARPMSPPLVAAATSPPTASPIAGEQQHHSINDDPMTLGRSMTLGTSIFSSSSSGGISRPYRAAGGGFAGAAASSSSSSTTETPDDEAELDPEALAACKERMCGASHPSIDLEERTLTRMNGGCCCCCSQAPGSSQRGRERDPDDRAHVRQRTPSLGIGTSRSIRFGSVRFGSSLLGLEMARAYSRRRARRPTCNRCGTQQQRRTRSFSLLQTSLEYVTRPKRNTIQSFSPLMNEPTNQ